MTDTYLLRSIVQKSGLKYKLIAEQLGITPYGLQKKIDNINEFKASEIARLCETLGITDPKDKDKIFFTQSVDYNSTTGIRNTG